MLSTKQYINGELVKGEGKPISVVCPGTGEVVGEFKAANAAQAQLALEAARDAFPQWSSLTLEERGEWMLKLAAAITEEREKIANLLAHETGKFISSSLREVDGLKGSLNFFLNQARSNYDETIRDPQGKHLFLTIREPLGVVVAYLAWNYPMANLSMKLGAVLASGCTAVIKPATRTPLSTLYIGEIMHRIGFPKGVINFVAGSARELGSVLTQSHIPAMLTIIGSSQAGRELIRDSATSVKRFSLELGGNAPVIVTRNSDVARAATVCMQDKFKNCGQLCISPQRVLVERPVSDEFLAAVRKIAEEARCGTLYDEDCSVGPMITPESVVRMETLVADALQKGATLVAGGKRPDYREKGNYFLPTVLANVTTDMQVFREEIFGPILAVMVYDDLDQAIALGNDTEYGLYAYGWTRDIVEANKIARGLHFGSVAINGAGMGIQLPHGGVKESGVGKDGSKWGLDEYYYIKSIRIPIVQ